MVNKLKYDNLKVLSILVFTLILSSSVLSFAVSSKYYNDNPLTAQPGETVDFVLTLQNLVGEDDIIAQANVVKGGEVVSIVNSQESYSIPFGEKLEVPFRAQIPSTASEGDVYNVEINFQTSTDSNSGQFNFGSGVTQRFDVLVVIPEPVVTDTTDTTSEDSSSNMTLIIIVLVVFIIVALVLIKKYSKKSSPKKSRKK